MPDGQSWRHGQTRRGSETRGEGELGGQLLAPTQTVCQAVVGKPVQGSGDKVNLIFKRQVWPALSWLRRFHEHNADDLVRHLYLVDRQLDGMVLEVDASITRGGAACWFGARRLQQGPPNAFVATSWTEEDEQLLGIERGVPAHQATWKRSWLCWQSVTLSLPRLGEGLCWLVTLWGFGLA